GLHVRRTGTMQRRRSRVALNMIGACGRALTPASGSNRDSSALTALPREARGYVTIFLCTRNGADYLQEQLASLTAQSYEHWRIVASDDGSSDATLALLGAFAREQADEARIEIRKGPKRGATANFLSLATDAAIGGDYFAYCDQDDVWYPQKLERAVAWLQSVPSDTAALYCSRTTLVSADGRE